MSDLDVKILIVDDEPVNILLLSKILSTEGYNNITTTLDPREAESLQIKHNFELILLDINMPELNGYEVLEQLHATDNFSGTKIVATSGDVSTKHIDEALAAGFNDYITKPMRMKDLLDVVSRVLHT